MSAVVSHDAGRLLSLMNFVHRSVSWIGRPLAGGPPRCGLGAAALWRLGSSAVVSFSAVVSHNVCGWFCLIMDWQLSDVMLVGSCLT